MKLSGCKKKGKGFRYYELNMRSIDFKESHPGCLVLNLTKEDLLTLASFCISLARDLPDRTIVDEIERVISNYEEGGYNTEGDQL